MLSGQPGLLPMFEPEQFHIYLFCILGFYKSLPLKKGFLFPLQRRYLKTHDRDALLSPLSLSLLNKNSSMGKTKMKMEANTKSAPKAL